MEHSLNDFLGEVFERNASDLHICVGAPVQLRIDGELKPTEKAKDHILTKEDCEKLCFSLLDEKSIQVFKETREFDSSFQFEDKCRFRLNFFYQMGSVAAALRPIPQKIPSMQDLGLPQALQKLTDRPNGLILVTGPTGSGKSTTLASMIDAINQNRHEHIITMEDPIEFVYESKNCLIAQREIGKDSQSFTQALKYVLRQDPDIVLVGELRDLETISAAITISETGHLVLATLHTNSAAQTINRIIDAFPAHQQNQVRAQLSFVLEAVISQQLIPKQGGGRVLAQEVLIPNYAVRNLIREDKIHQIKATMQMNQQQTGMSTMNQSLMNAIKNNLADKDTAIEFSNDPEELKKMLGVA